MKLVPLADKLIVKPMEAEQTTKSGIVIPDTAKERPQRGEVIAISSQGACRIDGGVVTKLEIKVGDKVLYAKYGPTEVKLDGEEYLILSGSDVLAIIK